MRSGVGECLWRSVCGVEWSSVCGRIDELHRTDAGFARPGWILLTTVVTATGTFCVSALTLALSLYLLCAL